MASKYESIVDKLPREFGTESHFQEKVNEIKKQILESPPDEKDLSSDALEDLVIEVTALQSVINDSLIKAVGGQPTAARLTQIWTDLRKMKDSFDEQEKVTNALLEAYKQILVDQCEEEGLATVKFRDGSGMRLQYEPNGRVVDREANRKWAMNTGLENLLSLPWQTVNSLTKQALLRGEDAPPGVEATTRVKVVKINP